jgi:hypothetical protein
VQYIFWKFLVVKNLRASAAVLDPHPPVGQNTASLLILWRLENFAPFRPTEQNPFIRVVTTDDEIIKTFINQT